MNKTKITRISADLDNLDEKKLEHCIKVFKKYGFDRDLKVEKSPSGRGYHVTVWSDRGLPLHESLMVRKHAGDDSISEDTRLYWKENGKLRFTKISELYKSFKQGNKIRVLTAKIIEKKCKNVNLRQLMTPPYTKIIWGEITDCWYRGKKEVYCVELNNGKCIEITKDHSLFGRRKSLGWTNRIEPLSIAEMENKEARIVSVDTEITDYNLKDILNLFLEANLFTDMSDNLRKLYIMLNKRGGDILTSREIYKEFREKYGTPSKNDRAIPSRGVLNGYMEQLNNLGLIIKKEIKTNGWQEWEINESETFKDTEKKMLSELKELLILCGLWLADGCYDGASIHISTGGDKNIINWINSYVSKIKNDYNKFITIKISKFRKGDVIFSSYRLVGIMKYLGFIGKSINKKTPSFVFTLPNEYIAQLLKGYFSGDGCLSLSHNVPIVAISSISKDLIYGTKILLSKLGIESNVKYYKREMGFGSNRKRVIYTLTIEQRNSVRAFLKKIGFIKKYDKKLYEIHGRKRKFDIYLYKIRKIGYVGIKDVYDIEIKPTNSFVAEGILCHNSMRIYLDAKTGRMRQVLFDHKVKKTISVEELLGG